MTASVLADPGVAEPGAAVLTLNAGSSSLKFALFEVRAGLPRLASRGQIEGIGTAPHLIARDQAGAILTERRWPDGAALGQDAFLAPLFAWIEDHLSPDRLAAIGHRIVHGGMTFSAPVLIDDQVLTQLDALCPLAPEHQPHNLAAVRAARGVAAWLAAGGLL